MLLGLILAAAGGGSSSFGGGGGGGGGGGFSSGGSSYGGGVGTGGGLGFAIIVVIIVAIILFGVVSSWIATRKYRARRDARVRQVELASAEAAEDDEWFAKDAVVAAATELFGEVQKAWDRRDTDKLGQMVFPDLLVEWKRRLKDFEKKGWHNRVELTSGPFIEYVGLVNREDDSEDRVCVRIEAVLDDYVEDRNGTAILHEGATSRSTTLCEYWTLAWNDGHWLVATIEQQAEGDHNLDGEIVASPWGDTKRLQDDSLVELAVAEKVENTVDIATVDFAGDARAEALDLSLADARFAPDVLEVAARRAVSGWAIAVDGKDDALLEVATEDAARQLLYGSGDANSNRRVVVRGVEIQGCTIEDVDASTQPARMTLVVKVRGRRYVEDRDTAAVLSGDKDNVTTFTERWTLTLDGPDTAPWRIVSAQGTVSALW